MKQKHQNRLDASVHMFFMRMDLTIVWVNSDLQVVDVQLAKRWHPVYLPRKPALYVLELSAARIFEFDIGDQLVFEDMPV